MAAQKTLRAINRRQVCINESFDEVWFQGTTVWTKLPEFRTGLGNNPRRLDVVELGEMLFQIRIADIRDGRLVRTVAAGRALSVTHVQVHHVFHSLNDFPERCETLR